MRNIATRRNIEGLAIGVGVVIVLWFYGSVLFGPPTNGRPVTEQYIVLGAWLLFGVLSSFLVLFRDRRRLSWPTLILVAIILGGMVSPGPEWQLLFRFPGTWSTLGLLAMLLVLDP